MFFGCQNMRSTQIFYLYVCKSQSQQVGTPQNLIGHVGVIAQDNKVVFWIKPHLLFLILWLNLKYQNSLRFIRFYSLHTCSIMLWTNINTAKLILIRNTLKHPQKYDFFKTVSLSKRETFY